jgi:hypothetical protein
VIGKAEYKTSAAERERKRRYYLENAARIKAQAKQWKLDNPAKAQQHNATYRDRWQIELNIKASGYYLREGDAILCRQRARYAAGKAMTYRRAGA